MEAAPAAGASAAVITGSEALRALREGDAERWEAATAKLPKPPPERTGFVKWLGYQTNIKNSLTYKKLVRVCACVCVRRGPAPARVCACLCARARTCLFLCARAPRAPARTHNAHALVRAPMRRPAPR